MFSLPRLIFTGMKTEEGDKGWAARVGARRIWECVTLLQLLDEGVRHSPNPSSRGGKAEWRPVDLELEAGM